MNYRLRDVGPGDLELVCRHRFLMFEEAGKDGRTEFREWVRPRLDDGSYYGWIVEGDEGPVAGLGMITLDWPPHPSHPRDDRRGYVLNVYVDPAHRKRGLAKRLMEQARDEAVRRGLVFMTLHATAQGRPLYDGLGWTPTTEMSLAIGPNEPDSD